MKKVKNFTVIALAAVIGAGVLFSCQKDNSILGDKNLKSLNEELQRYEYYSPNESEISEKLIAMTNYLNTDEGMPNMELKEAIWFMEAFFNIGICEKQKNYVENTYLKKKYSFTVPIVEAQENIILNGTVFKSTYKEKIEQILAEILPSYAIDFVDIFVSNIQANEVIFEIMVIYGTKAEKSFNVLGRKRFIEPTQDPLANFSNPTFYYPANGTDSYMEGVLHPNYPQLNPRIGAIKEYKKSHIGTYEQGGIDMFPGNHLLWTISCEDFYVIHFHKNNQNWYNTAHIGQQICKFTVPAEDYETYGAIYRDLLYGGLIPDIPAPDKILKAYVEFTTAGIPDEDHTVIIFHDFGIEYIYEPIDITYEKVLAIHYKHDFLIAYPTI